jgi:2-polyprenyl-3-methyl-5-hydroxy-6-metoxy-1,4-benzoquinol methylase
VYEIIAREYSRIFPPDPQRVSFALNIVGPQSASVLDIGAATGDFACQLATKGHLVTAYEPDVSMISIAQKRPQVAAGNPQFYSNSMLDLNGEDAYKAIFCMGNTLPHLRNREELLLFFRKAHKSLTSAGNLVIQLLNYDNILKKESFTFSDVDIPGYVFKRSYSSITTKYVRFEIALVSCHNQETFTSSTMLFPITMEMISDGVKSAGFADIRFYKDYAMNPSDGSEPHYIAVASV